MECTPAAIDEFISYIESIIEKENYMRSIQGADELIRPLPSEGCSDWIRQKPAGVYKVFFKNHPCANADYCGQPRARFDREVESVKV